VSTNALVESELQTFTKRVIAKQAQVVQRIANSFNFVCTHERVCHENCFERVGRQCHRLNVALRKVYGEQMPFDGELDRRRILFNNWNEYQVGKAKEAAAGKDQTHNHHRESTFMRHSGGSGGGAGSTHLTPLLTGSGLGTGVASQKMLLMDKLGATAAAMASADSVGAGLASGGAGGGGSGADAGSGSNGHEHDTRKAMDGQGLRKMTNAAVGADKNELRTNPLALSGQKEPPIVKYIKTQVRQDLCRNRYRVQVGSTIHAPIALMLKSALIMNDTQYVDIIPVVWEMLLQKDVHVVASAGKMCLVQKYISFILF
jgi:hypothetical protein